MKRKVVILGSIATSLLNFRGDLIKELIERGFEVVAAAPDMTDKVASRLKELGARPHSVAIARTGMNPLKDVASMLTLLRFLRREKPAAIVSYTAKPVIYGTIAAWLAGITLRVAMITGLGYSFMEGKEWRRKCANWSARFLYGIALPRATAVIFQNPDDREMFQSLGLLSKHCKTGIVNGSGVDVSHYAPAALPRQPCFLMIARFMKDKGIREYAEAGISLKRKMPFVRVCLVGWRDPSPNSVSEAELERWTSLGIENFSKQDDVRAAIAQASVIVLPSYREGTPRSVLEGMSMGRAVITTDVPGCRETVVQGKNGILVAPRNAMALEEAMLKLAHDPELVAAMGKTSRHIVETRYESKSVARATLNLAGLV